MEIVEAVGFVKMACEGNRNYDCAKVALGYFDDDNVLVVVGRAVLP